MTAPGTTIGDRYRLVGAIATGGMGTVWEAWDERLQRRVAIKQLHPQPGLSAADARLAGERALREARITARLHHPHAVPVYDVVDHDGQPCLVMQYLPAKSLQQLLAERGPLDVAPVARIGSEIASALDAAHRVGIVHRDVKPGNVLIDADGAAKLTDFGISHALGDATLTSTGLVTGTPAFLAPEVARGAPSTPASDVFSLGSTLYTALEGTTPFGDGLNAMATLHRVASGEITPPRRTGPLTPLLQRMLAVDPGHRPSMAEVTHRLRDQRRLAANPAAFAPTEHFPPPPRRAGPPPSSTVVLPAATPAHQPPPGAVPPRRRRSWLVPALVGLALLAGALVGLLVAELGSGGGHTPAAQGSSSLRPRTSPATRATNTPAPTTRGAATSAPPATTAGPPQGNTAPPHGSAKPAGGAADSDPAAAVDSYYALLPGNTDSAWNLLTEHFQNTRADGRDSYDRYWAGVRSVTVTDAVATGKKDAEATITYRYKDGRTVAERTAFHFKDEGGVLKIDRTDTRGD